MKKVLCFFIGAFILLGCQQTAIDKPDNLIEEDTMEDILYDLALLDAIRTNNSTLLDKKNITTSTYVYDKYDIDSLQFANSNHYYASDVHNYLKMYQRVETRLAGEKTKIDTIIARESRIITTPKQPKALKNLDSIKRSTNLEGKSGKN